jgi:plastocyanin
MALVSGMKKYSLLLFVLALSILLAAAVACGGGGGDDGDGGDDVTPADTTPADGDGGEVSFDVSMGDNFFEPKEFTVPAGATVTFNLTNDGTAIHNMRVAGADNEYGTEDDVLSDPDLVNAGDTAALPWEAPEDAGDHDFRCELHPTDMFGTITVE